MLSSLFAPVAIKVSAGIVAVLVLLVAILGIQLDAADDRAARFAAKAATSEDRHAVTRASLRTLEGEMARLVADGAAREHRVRTALTEQQKRSVVLREEAAQIIAAGLTDPCKTPEFVLRSKGL